MKYLNYILPVINSLLAFLYLAKDWDSHKKSWRRLLVLVLIILIGLIGAFNGYYIDGENKKQHEKDQRKIDNLQGAVETAIKIQEDNMKYFSDTYSTLSKKLSDLQTQLKTVGLQKEADQLKKELVATQKAMSPPPKAILDFTFAKPNIDDPPLKVVALPVKNNVVHLEFSIKNNTSVPAMNGIITLIICRGCKFVSDPPKFRKVPGPKDTEYNLPFDRLLSNTESEVLSADVMVPPGATSIEFGVNYRCVNCIVPDSRANIGVVHLIR